MAGPRPFRIDIPQPELDRIRARVAGYPWDDVAMPDDGGWDYGTNRDDLKALCAYWVDSYDWRTQEAGLNRFAHFIADVDGIDIHFVREPGSGANPVPLILIHGWPGSVVEFTDFIDRLAHPERFGGRAEDGLTVIAPSLPGFGWSGRPPRPWGPRRMARCFNALMSDVLGYDSYVAQGGDWGGAIASWLGFDHASHCRAIHINILTMRTAEGPQTPQEVAWADAFARDQVMEDGYRTQQATRPQTLSYAMMDSPVGVAAWILEKIVSWSDTTGNDPESVYSRDQILTNIMVYIVTRTFNTASWIYYGRREEGGRILSPEGRRVEVPTGCAVFPAEMLRWPPRSYAERLYNVQRWSVFARGGHFAAWEQPEALAEDVLAFFRGR